MMHLVTADETGPARPKNCREQLCPRASFTESLPALRTSSRLTTRPRTELRYPIAEQACVLSESAAHFGVDSSIVHNAFKGPCEGPGLWTWSHDSCVVRARF